MTAQGSVKSSGGALLPSASTAMAVAVPPSASTPSSNPFRAQTRDLPSRWLMPAPSSAYWSSMPPMPERKTPKSTVTIVRIWVPVSVGPPATQPGPAPAGPPPRRRARRPVFKYLGALRVPGWSP